MFRFGEAANYVRLTTVGSAATAHIMAARLQAEGIEVRVHGASLGPYPMTVGQMAETELWVPADQLADASEIMLDAATNDVLEPVERGGPPVRGPRIEMRAVALVLGLILAVLYVLRIAAVY